MTREGRYSMFPSALRRTRFHIQEMSTKTTTAVTHYHIQKKRRAEFIEDWRKNRRSVIRKDDVVLVERPVPGTGGFHHRAQLGNHEALH